MTDLGTKATFGTKMRIAAADIRPGDFTNFNGMRHVLSVRPCSNRRVAILRSDETFDRIARDQEVVVYRKDIAT